MKLYLSGPMSGLPDLNFPAFHAAAAQLRAAGYEVVNPAELNPEPGKTWAQCMRVDIKALLDCDAVAVLRGWVQSKGATIEVRLATDLGMPWRPVDFWLSEAESPNAVVAQVGSGA